MGKSSTLTAIESKCVRSNRPHKKLSCVVRSFSADQKKTIPEGMVKIKNGGIDGTRTRGLLRDRQAL